MQPLDNPRLPLHRKRNDTSAEAVSIRKRRGSLDCQRVDSEGTREDGSNLHRRVAMSPRYYTGAAAEWQDRGRQLGTLVGWLILRAPWEHGRVERKSEKGDVLKSPASFFRISPSLQATVSSKRFLTLM